MSGWVMSIVGVITLGVLLDILIPEGQTNKYIKGIFAIITLFVIISPLPKILNKDLSFEQFFDFKLNNYELDQQFISNINSQKYDYRNTAVEKLLEQNNYKGAKVKVVKRMDNMSKIDYVNVYLSGAVLPQNVSHINITNEIKKLVSDFLGINKDAVRVLYG